MPDHLKLLTMKQSIHLLDLINRQKLEKILRIFTEITGVASIITEIDGRPITKPHNFRKLCLKYSRSTEKGRSKCYQSDSYGGRETARLKKCLIYECLNAGLLDSGAPIIVEGYHLANILCGQVLEKPIDRDTAIRRARSIDIVDIDGYLEALAQIPVMSRERLRATVNLMEMITQTISELALQKYLLQRNSQRFLNKLINSVTDCIIATDADKAISMINESGAAMFGRESRSLIGQSIKTLLVKNGAEKELFESMRSNTQCSIRSELTVVTADKKTFPVHVSLSKLSANDQKKEGYVAVMRDITEEKQVERMKEDLIGMLTHDMQNPTLSIQKAVELLLDGSLGDLNADQMEILNLVLGTSRQLLGMVTDFLDIYRNENGKFLLHKLTFDINQLFHEGINQVVIFADEKQISIRSDVFSEPVLLEGDRNRLIRMFINLMDNAIKFSPKGEILEVSARLVNGKDDTRDKAATSIPSEYQLQAEQPYILASVTDNGPGIKPEYHRQIFEKFFSAKTNPNRGRKGLGLGLSFCKLVVEAHHGAIWVDSPVNTTGRHPPRGSRFSFIIPAENDA